MRIFVTGADSFIGRNLTAFLKSKGNSVIGWDYEYEMPDLKQFEWVIHLGSSTRTLPSDILLEQNFTFPKRVFQLAQAAGVNFQYDSSCEVYATDTSEYSECMPVTGYARTKLMFDDWVFKQPNSAFVQGFRYFDVYGKWQQNSNLLAHWHEEAAKHKTVTVWNGIERVKRDWVWVGDLCSVQYEFLQHVKGSGIWNIGTGLAHNLLDVAEEIAAMHAAELVHDDTAVNQFRLNKNMTADLAVLKSTLGKRKWLNLYEWLALEKG